MSAIGPGDWVERIRPSSFFTVRAVYHVADMEGTSTSCAKCDGCAGVRLVGHPNPHDLGKRRPNWWPSCGFRPIYRPKSELLESLLRKSDEPGKEMA